MKGCCVLYKLVSKVPYSSHQWVQNIIFIHDIAISRLELKPYKYMNGKSLPYVPCGLNLNFNMGFGQDQMRLQNKLTH